MTVCRGLPKKNAHRHACWGAAAVCCQELATQLAQHAYLHILTAHKLLQPVVGAAEGINARWLRSGLHTAQAVKGSSLVG